MPDGVREQAERELGRFERMGESSPEASMIRSYLDWLLAVPWGERSEDVLDPEHTRTRARRGSRGARGRQGPDRRVHRCREAAPRARHRARPAGGRDPDARRSARHRQDLDRRVGRPRAQPRVRAHVARRHPRRGRDPRPPAHLHRRAARPARAGAARRRHDEPGHPPRRGRQGRRRLARRSVRRAARGARPGAEPLVPRPLPRCRARPLPGLLHRDGQRGRVDPGAAARPHGGDPLRRVHDRREGRPSRSGYLWPRQRERAGLREDEVSIADDALETVVSEYTREAGVRQLERELGAILRKTATKIASDVRRAARRDRRRGRA